MIRNILSFIIVLFVVIVNAQEKYIPKPLLSHEPIIYCNVDLGYTRGVKRVIVIDSENQDIEGYGFNRDGFQTYYVIKKGVHVDSTANIYSNQRLIKNEFYEDGIRMDYRTYDYKKGNLILSREFWDENMTKTSFTYRNGRLIKSHSKMIGINFFESYEFIDPKNTIQRKKVAKRVFEITNVIDTKPYKSIEVYDPENLERTYQKKVYRYKDDLLIEFRIYHLNREYMNEKYTYDDRSMLRNVKQYRSEKLYSETFFDAYGNPEKVCMYYNDSEYRYENKYNEKGDLVGVNFINNGNLAKSTKFEIEYW